MEVDRPAVYTPHRHRAGRLGAFLMCLGAISLLAADDSPRSPAMQSTGHLIRVPLPITGNSDKLVRLKVRRLLENLSKNEAGGTATPVLVFEFATRSKSAGGTSEFGRAYELAKFLVSEELNRVRTVAYVPGPLKGHAVLPAMACQELIMGSGGELGDPGWEGVPADGVVRNAYQRIAELRQTLPAPMALGMLDRRLEVIRARVGGGWHYLFASELEELRKTVNVAEIETLIPAGELGHFSAAALRDEFGFASYVVDDHNELAQVLKVSAVEEDPSLGGGWRAIRLNLGGIIGTRKVRQITRGIEDKLQADESNFVCLWIDSPGGSLEEASTLANYLASLRDRNVRTVAYVPRQARGAATLIVLACDDLVMHDDAVLGGEGVQRVKDGMGPLDMVKKLRDAAEDDQNDDQDNKQEQDKADLAAAAAGQAAALRENIRQIAAEKSRSWSLWAAMTDRQMKVYRYRRAGSGQEAFFGEDELGDQRDPNEWQQGEEVTTAGVALRLDGRKAEELRIARHLVSDYDDLKQAYDLDEEPEVVRPNWALELIEALSSPTVAGFLLFIGGFALISEFMSPGIGVAGFLAGLCFLLFFWSQLLNGTAGWLEVLLFLAGVICVALELFVLPGFGIFGVGGGALMITALVLASQTFVIPQNEYQYQQLPRSLLTVVAAGAGVMSAMYVMRRYLHRAPVVSRVMLHPPSEEQSEELNRREALVDLNHLIGKRGVTTTRLTPSGKARVGDQVVDVISDGEAIPQGAPVFIVEVRGNVVVVQAVEPPGGGAIS